MLDDASTADDDLVAGVAELVFPLGDEQVAGDPLREVLLAKKVVAVLARNKLAFDRRSPRAQAIAEARHVRCLSAIQEFVENLTHAASPRRLGRWCPAIEDRPARRAPQLPQSRVEESGCIRPETRQSCLPKPRCLCLAHSHQEPST